MIGRRLDVLAWKDAFTRLVTDFGVVPVERRNTVWFTFMGRFARQVHPDWERPRSRSPTSEPHRGDTPTTRALESVIGGPPGRGDVGRLRVVS